MLEEDFVGLVSTIRHFNQWNLCI